MKRNSQLSPMIQRYFAMAGPPGKLLQLTDHCSSDEEAGMIMSLTHFRSETDIFIAVMGVTGCGKSSLISLCCKRPVRIGHDLQACQLHSPGLEYSMMDLNVDRGTNLVRHRGGRRLPV